eukprot:TRINITY_DN83_c0_g1_i10.p1 TRINITY_DN83_c0_g1~~TRINITY_DN83_c0_g1_i10.p1  ORF type:complete len:1894 (+),score=550.29 TRINITY_DN83_c0_g1_i10:110-5791(+)
MGSADGTTDAPALPVGTPLFDNLGQPVKELLLEVASRGSEVSEGTLELLQHVTVKQLAMIFEMLGHGEDAETILIWLKRRGRKARAHGTATEAALPQPDVTDPHHDPVAYLQALEEANAAKAQELQEAEDDRDLLRRARAPKRAKALATQQEARAAAQQTLQESGAVWDPVGHLGERDLCAVGAIFERFADTKTEADNEGKEDGEWWRAEPLRVDWENNGTKWKACAPGADVVATDAEVARREGVYQDEWWKAHTYHCEDSEEGGGKHSGVCPGWAADAEDSSVPCSEEEKQRRRDYHQNGDWWKSESAKQDYMRRGAGADGLLSAKPLCEEEDWWKQPQYIDDFFQNKEGGRRWLAKTEADGIAARGKFTPAHADEQKRREEWYSANWWKQSKCTRDYQENGGASVAWQGVSHEPYDDMDWWKQAPFVQDWADNMKSKTLPSAEEWWKQPQYIEDYLRGEEDRWCAQHETHALQEQGQDHPVSSDGKADRSRWYEQNWWKAPQFAMDWGQYGASGDAWRAGSHAAALDPARGARNEPCSNEEQMQRMAWYRPEGHRWNAMNEGAGQAGKATEVPCTAAEAVHRDEWYRTNWWKAPQYVQDWQNAGNEWCAGSEWAAKDGTASDRTCSEAESHRREMWYRTNADGEWWFSDHWARDGGSDGKWTADHRSIAKRNAGVAHPATPADKVAREAWYKDNWWKRPACIEDWRANGQLWLDAEPADPTVLWWQQPLVIADYQQNGDDGVEWTLAHRDTPQTPLAQGPDREMREAWYKDNWWKAPKHIQDWSRSGRSWAEDATPEEQEARDEWYRTHAPKPIPDAEQATRVAWYRDHCSQPEPAELSARKAWYRCQLDDDTKARRLEWYRNCTDNSKRVFIDELPELLTDINEGQAPTEADVKALISCVSRLHSGEDPAEEPQYVSKGTFIRAVAETGLYVRDDDDGLDMRAEEVLHDLQRRDMQEREEIAAHWAMAAGEGSDGQPSETGDEPEEPVACAWDNRPHDAPPCCAASDAQPSEAGDKPDEGARCQLSCCSRDVPDVKPSEAGDEPEEPVAWENRPHDEAGAEPHEHASRTWKYGPHDASVCCGTSDTRLSEASDEPDAGGCCPGLTPDTESCGPAEDPSEEGSEEGGEACPGCCYTCANPDPEYHDCCTWINGPDATPRRIRFYSDEPEGGMPVESSCSSDEEDDCSEASPMVDDELDSLIECPGPYDDEPEWSEDEEDPEADIYPGGVGSDNGSWSDDDSDDASGEGLDEPWVLPLPEVTNNVYLKSYFPTLKWHASRKPTAADRRVWVVDHFAKSFYCLDAKGKMKDQHPANKLVQLERNIMDPRRARLLFFDAPRSFEVIFQSTEERERFYETASSIRPAIRVYAPSLTKPDTAHNGSIVTTIDGTKANSVTHLMPNPFQKTGALVDREFSGRCNINASSIQDEPVDVWCGTFNLSGAAPPCDPACLEAWMPRGTHDIYAVGAQGVSYQSEEGEWFSYVQDYLGKDYLVLSSLQMWDVSLIVLCRKKCLLKITNVEGSTKATLHKEKCGMKGAAGICLKYHNTSMAFISCHLAARLERTKMRRINVEEIINQILLANKDTDLSSQFHHVFWMGDMNYRVEMEGAEAEPLVQQKNWMELLNHDQLLTEMRETGLMHGFKEAPITFAPTYRYKVGTNDYMRDRGRAPSYTDRILVKSLGNTDIKCTGYEAAETVKTSEHFPVSSTYVVRCVRPHASCFHRDQEPRPQFNFSEIKFIDQTHLMFRKPMVMMYSPFSEHAHRGKPMKTSTMLPEFTGEALPEPIQIVVQMTEYLERNSILIIFRDNAEPREDKMFRGSASMELKGCVEPYDEEREAQLDVICLGRKVGVVSVKYKVTNYGYTPPPGCTQGRVPKETLMDPDAGEAEDDDDEE